MESDQGRFLDPRQVDVETPKSTKPNLEEGRVWQLVILISVSFYAPLQVWANSAERAEVTAFLILGLVMFLVAVAAKIVLALAGLNDLASTYAVAVLIVSTSNLGSLIGRPFGRWFLLMASLLLAVLAYRWRRFQLFRLTVAWGAIALVLYPIALAIFDAPREDTGGTLDGASVIQADLVTEARDTVLIVVDGYASGEVLLELYQHDNQDFFEDLARQGFDSNPDLVANYGRTRLSLAGILQMDYPLGESTLTSADLDELLEVIRGRNAMADWFKERGYRLVYVESGWFGTRCGDDVDVCIESPWPDESVYDLASRSLLRNMPGLEIGRPFSEGAQHAIAWLREDLEGYLTDDVHDFIFVHLLLPHPPLLTDENCEMKTRGGVPGFSIWQQGMDAGELREARDRYVAQVQCVNKVLTHTAKLLAQSNANALVFGDHGPDSQGQLYNLGAEWDADQRWERLTTMAIARVPGCDMSHLKSLVNIGRRFVSCVSNQTLDDLDVRVFEIAASDDGIRLVGVPEPEIAP